MPHRCATVECAIYPSSLACPIRVRYSDTLRACDRVDLAAGACDCHLVHIERARDGAGMKVHFTGCRAMLADLPRALQVRDIEEEDGLLSPWAGEYRQAGVCVGCIDGVLDRDAVLARLARTGRPVELADREPDVRIPADLAL